MLHRLRRDIAVVLMGLTAMTCLAQTRPSPSQRGEPMVHLPEGKDHITLKLSRFGSLLMVRGTIDDEEAGWLVVDTGASGLFIDRSVAEKLKLPLIVTGAIREGQLPLDMVRCRSLLLQGENDRLKIDLPFAVSADLRSLNTYAGVKIAGLVGGNIFRPQPFSIDFREDTLTFYQRKGFAPPATQPFEARMWGDLPRVRGVFNGHEGWFLLDTGQTGAFTVHAAVITLHDTLYPGEHMLRSSAADASGIINHFSSRFRSFATLGIERTGAWGSVKGGTFDAKPWSMTESGQIGAAILADAKLTCDYTARQIWVERRPPEALEARVARLRERARRSVDRMSALYRAADEGRQDVLRALIDAGEDVNSPNVMGFTPLSCAAAGHPQCTRLLLDAGANPNTQAAMMGIAPLHTAAKLGDVESVKLLLKAGAKPNVTTTLNQTPLSRACEGRWPEVVRALLEAGADVNIAEKGGDTALMFAVESGDEEIVRLLLDRGADLSARRTDGTTPLLMAARYGRAGLVRLLLDHHAEVAPKYNPQTALHAAASGGDLECVELILRAGAAIDAKDRNGKTPLQVAAEKGQLQVVGLLTSAAPATTQSDHGDGDQRK